MPDRIKIQGFGLVRHLGLGLFLHAMAFAADGVVWLQPAI